MRFIYVFIALVLWSCSRNNKVQQQEVLGYNVPPLLHLSNDSLTEIEVNLSNMLSSIRTSEIIDSIWWVPLETTENSTFGVVQQVEFYDGKIFILDNIMASGLFVFDSLGKHLYTIDTHGKGPGEFYQPTSFTINREKNEIVISDDWQGKLLSYDLTGNFLKEITKFSLRFNEMQFIDTNKIIFHTGRRANGHILELKYNSIVIGTPGGDFTAKNFAYDPSQQLKHGNKSFFRYNDELYFHYPFRDTVYQVDAQRIVPQYVINLGENKLPIDFELGLDARGFSKKYENKKSSYAYTSPMGFFISDHHIYHEVVYKRRRVFVYYSKDSGKVRFTDNLITDLPQTVLFGAYCGGYGDVMVNFVPPEVTIQANEYFSKNPKDAASVSPATLSLIKEMSSNAMPMLVCYTLKRF